MVINLQPGTAPSTNDATAQQNDTLEWYCAAINKGLAAANCGEFIEHATLKVTWKRRLANAASNSRE